METLIFLAGASAADGAPLQGAVFREYLRSVQENEFIRLAATQWSASRALPRFLDDFFGIRSRDADLDSIQFPTFEEAIGILEIARRHSESFGHVSYRVGKYPTNSPTLEQMRFILVEVLAAAIRGDGTRTRGVHAQLCRNLQAQGKLSHVVFVTFNYDTLLEQALASETIDYGFDTNPFVPGKGSLQVLKIHGSLDWLYCDSCFSVESAGACPRISNQCAECKDFLVPLIVPPTFFKEMENPLLASIWRSFRRALTKTRHVVFCGYSFPDADLHVKYAFKHREVVKRLSPLKVSVVNEHSGKTQSARVEEAARFSRFFREDVNFTSYEFEDFASDPSILL